MASASTPSANEQAKDLILVHSTAKANEKAQISGRMEILSEEVDDYDNIVTQKSFTSK